jgi:hypothetical protein
VPEIVTTFAVPVVVEDDAVPFGVIETVDVPEPVIVAGENTQDTVVLVLHESVTTPEYPRRAPTVTVAVAGTGVF